MVIREIESSQCLYTKIGCTNQYHLNWLPIQVDRVIHSLMCTGYYGIINNFGYQTEVY